MGKLIGLGGYAYAGKDAFADVLEQDLGWYKTYMSKALRQSLEVLDPIVDTFLGRPVRFSEAINAHGYEEAKKNPEVRALLQRMGTEVGRKLWNDNFWVDLCFGDVADKLMMKNRNVVVTGIRYPNELHRIQNLSGVSIWITRPGYLAVNEHSSDNTLCPDDFDHTFSNHGTLEDLKVTVPEFIRANGWSDNVTETPQYRGDPFGWLKD